MHLSLRPSDADRRRALSVLKRGYVTGRLNTETLEARVLAAETARSRADLRALLADVSARWGTTHALLRREPRERGPATPWAVLLLSRSERTVLLVGRSSACDVVFAADAVSRRHARLERDGDAWSVTDLGSMNGTYVDGVRVERAPVERGTRLRLGDAYLDIV